MAGKRKRSSIVLAGRKRFGTRGNYKQVANKRTTYARQIPTLSQAKYVVKQGRSDYAQTLINPFARIDCRIPDMACYDTCTFTNEYHQMVPITAVSTATTANNCGITVALKPGGVIQYWQACSGVLATNGALSAYSGAVARPGEGNTFTRYKSARLVSAAIKIQFAGADTETGGEIIGAFYPADYKVIIDSDGTVKWDGSGLTNGLPATTNYSIQNPSQLKAMTSNYSEGPLKNGVYVRYKPQDSLSYDMVAPYVMAAAEYDTFGTFVCLVAPKVDTQVQIDVVLNYEGIVINNDLGLASATSAADPGALAHGINAAGRSASCFPASGVSRTHNIDNILKSVG